MRELSASMAPRTARSASGSFGGRSCAMTSGAIGRFLLSGGIGRFLAYGDWMLVLEVADGLAGQLPRLVVPLQAVVAVAGGADDGADVIPQLAALATVGLGQRLITRPQPVLALLAAHAHRRRGRYLLVWHLLACSLAVVVVVAGHVGQRGQGVAP